MARGGLKSWYSSISWCIALLVWHFCSCWLCLKCTAAVPAHSVHPPLHATWSFSSYTFCRGALTQPVKSVQPSISHHTSLPEPMPFFEEAGKNYQLLFQGLTSVSSDKLVAALLSPLVPKPKAFSSTNRGSLLL